MSRATGIGSWPGTDPAAANGAIRNLFADEDLPYLAELPARGPGADLIGRGAALLVDLPVELTLSGWRHADAPGRDAGRAAGYLHNDLDTLAETYDGYAGDLKIQLTGPWTLAASIELRRGERTLTDPGAVADLIASLADGARRYVADVQRLVPGARVVVQVDEPSLPAVLAGRLPTASGYGRVRAVDPQTAESGLRTVLTAVADHDPLVHCCDPAIPVPLLRRAGSAGIALDATALTPARWESLAVLVEDGGTVYAGCLATDAATAYPQALATLLAGWERVGLEISRLGQVIVSPACGLPNLTPEGARNVHLAARDLARALTEKEHE